MISSNLRFDETMYEEQSSDRTEPTLTAANPSYTHDQVCEPKSTICKPKRGVKTVLSPKKKYKVWANGCGTDSIGFQLMGDENLDFTECCNWHDACYGICGISKTLCEKKFSKCMKDKCALEPTTELQKSCGTTAELYAMGPNMMGCPAFTAGQKEACECVDESKAATRNRNRLEHFLATHARDGAEAEDVDALLAKYKGKEPVMFLRLLAKYPEALTLKKARVSDTDKMFESLKKHKQEKAKADEHNDVEAHIEL
ncbi:hypothetical protein DYB30_010013 [Aphanomyces astaci]|uniref:Phospholipase A2 domain-containing protein n=1 Tax=Aphanomyces astaci TaxID=112090 RepID=A0A397CIL6_APHAT|nr:hypothetical protein DYB30_010013 [Aphanomyces astaci]